MSKNRMLFTLMVFTFLLACPTMVKAADNFYVTVAGAIQGPFQGELFTAAFEHKTFRGLSFDYEVGNPRDPQSGALIGKRVHKPVILKKAWGPASLQLFSALTHNEPLTVVIDFFIIHRSGKLVLDHTLKLNNALVASFHSHANTEDLRAPQTDTIELVYQSIELIDQQSKVTVSDNAIGTQPGR